MNGEFIKANYHVHTNYCDGHDTPLDMINAAVQKGFTSLGVLCHSLYPFSSDWHIPVREHASFFAEINTSLFLFLTVKKTYKQI